MRIVIHEDLSWSSSSYCMAEDAYAAHSIVAVADTGVYLAVERLDAEDGSTSADTAEEASVHVDAAEDASVDAAVGRIGTGGCGASYAAVVQFCEWAVKAISISLTQI